MKDSCDHNRFNIQLQLQWDALLWHEHFFFCVCVLIWRHPYDIHLAIGQQHSQYLCKHNEIILNIVVIRYVVYVHLLWPAHFECVIFRVHCFNFGRDSHHKYKSLEATGLSVTSLRHIRLSEAFFIFLCSAQSQT